MTRNQIIEGLFLGKNFNDCLSKMEPDHLREDLKMEVITIVCEWPDEKVLKLYQDGALDFYVVRVILNQIKSNTSSFAKQYRHRMPSLDDDEKDKFQFVVIEHNNFHVNGDWENSRHQAREWTRDELSFFTKRAELLEVDTDSETDLEEREIREMVEDLTLKEIDSMYWYDAEMMRLYMKVGTFRAMQKETGIPFISCFKNIKKSLSYLKDQAKVKAASIKPVPLFTRKELAQTNQS